MEKIIQVSCLHTAKLLLCLFVFYCSSCSGLVRLDREAFETSRPILQVAVEEHNLPFFLQRIQELKLVPIDFQQRMADKQNKETRECWITFRLVTKNEFLVWRSEIISTGLASKVITKELE